MMSVKEVIQFYQQFFQSLIYNLVKYDEHVITEWQYFHSLLETSPTRVQPYLDILKAKMKDNHSNTLVIQAKVKDYENISPSKRTTLNDQIQDERNNPLTAKQKDCDENLNASRSESSNSPKSRRSLNSLSSKYKTDLSHEHESPILKEVTSNFNNIKQTPNTSYRNCLGKNTQQPPIHDKLTDNMKFNYHLKQHNDRGVNAKQRRPFNLQNSHEENQLNLTLKDQYDLLGQKIALQTRQSFENNTNLDLKRQHTDKTEDFIEECKLSPIKADTSVLSQTNAVRQLNDSFQRSNRQLVQKESASLQKLTQLDSTLSIQHQSTQRNQTLELPNTSKDLTNKDQNISSNQNLDEEKKQSFNVIGLKIKLCEGIALMEDNNRRVNELVSEIENQTNSKFTILQRKIGVSLHQTSSKQQGSYLAPVISQQQANPSQKANQIFQIRQQAQIPPISVKQESHHQFLHLHGEQNSIRNTNWNSSNGDTNKVQLNRIGIEHNQNNQQRIIQYKPLAEITRGVSSHITRQQSDLMLNTRYKRLQTIDTYTSTSSLTHNPHYSKVNQYGNNSLSGNSLSINQVQSHQSLNYNTVKDHSSLNHNSIQDNSSTFNYQSQLKQILKQNNAFESNNIKNYNYGSRINIKSQGELNTFALSTNNQKTNDTHRFLSTNNYLPLSNHASIEQLPLKKRSDYSFPDLKSFNKYIKRF